MEASDKTESLLDLQSSLKEDVDYIIDKKEVKFGYDVDETPPLFVTVTSALQHTFICIGYVLTVTAVLADVCCADLNDPVRSRLLCSSVLMIGLATAAQSLIGLRLPVFQGASSIFLIPLLALRDTDSWKCPSAINNAGNFTNGTTGNMSGEITSNIVYDRLAEIQGSLIAASMFEVLIGLTGLIGVLMKFISPIVIGVTIFCLGYSLYPLAIILSTPYWGISISGAVLMVLFSVYMAHIDIPLPRLRKTSVKKRFPVFQVFPVIFTMIIMWVISAICTSLRVFSDDPKDPSYLARTDVRNGIIRDSPWILIPYPGQFGIPRFNLALFVGFLISVMTSIIESIGDYVATSRICDAYPVPSHAINRGIAVEGMFSVLSGFYGTGHATTSYSTTVSLVDLTKICSRNVLVVSGILAVIFAILGKFGALMTSVPAPVLGGITLAMLGVLCSLGISAFQNIDFRSSRNISVIGTSIFVAIVLSEWQQEFPDSLRTDSEQVNQIVKVTLGNAMFMGFLLSVLLDNTVRGTDSERGIKHLKQSKRDVMSSRSYLFDLPLIGRLQQHCSLLRHLPFIQPYKRSDNITVRED